MSEKYGETAKLDSYMASMRNTMLAATGRTVEEWVSIAKTCPYTKHREQLKWFKTEYGLLQNRATLVLSEFNGHQPIGNEDPELLVKNLFSKYPELTPVYEALYQKVKSTWPEVTVSPRKAYIAFSNRYQFLIVVPGKAGLQIGLPFEFTHAPALLKALTRPIGGRDSIKACIFVQSEAELNQPNWALIQEAYHKS